MSASGAPALLPSNAVSRNGMPSGITAVSAAPTVT
jgi:hypothetical protein